ncbi:MAG TPA: hypothetical protein VHD69_00020 [Candidatus Paceibacterota bacterium]|jgi:hypothetical protein|nr:hypothetical protein [Candidatus Paceibacterota bacterium]
MSFNGYQKACALFFAILVAFWGVLYLQDIRETLANDVFVLLYGLMPLIGGGLALAGYRRWGGLSTILGKAILLLGFGLFLWGAGESTYSYYNIVLHVDIPYPSIADLFFAPSVFFYTLGAIYLSITTGVGLSLKSRAGKLFAVGALAIISVIAYYFLIVVGKDGLFISDSTNVLKTVLDVAYPLGDFISLAVSVVVAGLSFRYMNGLYKHDIMFVLAGLAAMFAADSIFSYTTTLGTAYNGDVGDLAFTVAIFLLTCGLLGFNKVKTAPAPAD